MLGFGKQVEIVGSTIVQSVEAERRARARRIVDAWKRYEGNHPKPLLPTGTDPKGADNTTVNLARKTVDIAAFYLFGNPIAFEVGNQESERDDWLKACWEANRQGSLLLEFGTSAGVTGDGFLRLYPARKERGETFPRIVSLDAANVEMETDPLDIADIVRFVVTFTGVVDGKARAYRHLIARSGNQWEIIEQESRGDSTSWITTNTERWPYAFAPIFHCKNLPNPHVLYGRSDIEADVLRLNDAISFVVSNINRILRVHGHPQLALTGTTAEKLDRAIDNIICLPAPESKILATPYVEDLTAHFDQLKSLREAYHELTSVPEIATGKLDSVGQLSGLALQILYAPLVQLVTVKRTFYGEMLMALCKALLELGGQATAEWITIQWPQILPTDRKAEADTALSLHEIGVSRDTLLTELGYDPDDEAEKRKTEQEADLEAQRTAFDRGQLGGGNPYQNNNENGA